MTNYMMPDHAARLKQALDDLHKAMTFRWREQVAYAIAISTTAHDPVGFTDHFEREVTSHDTPTWEYWSAAAQSHLWPLGSKCAFVRWVMDGQKGKLSSVTCPGETLSTKDDPTYDEYDNEIPPKIDCGMGRILEQVEGWARAECDIAYDRLPKFDHHDLGVIRGAHNDFLTVGSELGLKAGKKSGDLGDVSFDSVSGRDIVKNVTRLAGEDAEGQRWWAGWTGLAASSAKDGFFASVKPTLDNQSCILGALANLYSVRASIIEKGRYDGLSWVQWATKGLDETQEITTDLTTGWKVVQGAGTAIAISSGWTAVGGAVGAGVTLVGFLGENLIPEIKEEGYKHGLEEVVTKLFEEIDDLNTRLDELETDYGRSVRELGMTIWDIHSFNLELYDLTENSSGGQRESDDGFEMHMTDVLRIGEACFDAGEGYYGLLSTIDSTADADKHLADKDGNPASDDTALLEVRDQLKGFLKTTAGRYILAGEQVKASAEAYAATDDDRKAAFDDGMRDWEQDGVGDYDSDIKSEKWSKDTDRGDYPGSATDVDRDPPGANDEDAEDYVTEETS